MSAPICITVLLHNCGAMMSELFILDTDGSGLIIIVYIAQTFIVCPISSGKQNSSQCSLTIIFYTRVVVTKLVTPLAWSRSHDAS